MRAARSQAEAEALAALAGSLARPGSVGEMLGQLRVTFGVRAAALLAARRPRLATCSSARAPSRRPIPTHADVSRDLGGGVTLALAGGSLSASDERVLNAFAAQVAAAAERERLQGEAGKAADLAAANTLRGSLLQAVSHDLRTPLASIKASISSLRQRDIEWSPDDVDEFQRTIEEETDRLTDLVGNLLDMSRLQASALTRRAAPDRRRGDRARRGRQPRAAGVAASRSTCPRRCPTSLADRGPARAGARQPRRQRRAPRAGRRRRGSRPARSSSDGRAPVDIRVIDRGPGIRPADRELVFQPFQRLVDHQADGTGVGLGLAIARGFVEAMGGELTIDDTPGGGVDDGRQPARWRRDAERARDAGARRRRRGADPPGDGGQPARPAATTSTSPRPASRRWQLAARHHPDVVLLDLGLPGMDGLDVIDGLRGWTQVPIVVLSARGSERDKVAALDAGADDYVSKPFGMDELLARLRAAVRRADGRRRGAAIVTTDALHRRPGRQAGARPRPASRCA